MNHQYPILATELGVPLYGGDPYLPKIPLLNLIKRPLHVEGEYRNRHIKVWNFSRSSSSGKHSSSTPYYAIELQTKNPRDMKFQLGTDGFFAKIGKVFGMQDIQTGDPIFDEAFVVKCSEEAFVTGALLPEIRTQFLQITQMTRRGFGSLKLRNAKLRYERVGHLSKPEDREEAARLADAMSDLADALEVYQSVG